VTSARNEAMVVQFSDFKISIDKLIEAIGIPTDNQETEVDVDTCLEGCLRIIRFML